VRRCVLAGLAVLLTLSGSAEASPTAPRALPLRAAPLAVVAGHGSVWVLAERGDLAIVLKIAPRTGTALGTVKIGPPGPDIGAMTMGGGRIWAAAGDQLVAVDPARPAAVRRTRLPGLANAISYGFGSVWVTTIGQSRHLLIRLDSRTLTIRARIRLTARTVITGEGSGPTAVVAGLGSVWVAGFAALLRVDPATSRVASLLFPTSPSATGLAVARDRLWVLGGTTVAALDRRGRRIEQLRLPVAGGNVAVTHRRLWIIDNCGCRRGTLLEVSLLTRRVIRRRPTGETPIAVSATSTTVWVANFAGGTLSRFRTS